MSSMTAYKIEDEFYWDQKFLVGWDFRVLLGKKRFRLFWLITFSAVLKPGLAFAWFVIKWVIPAYIVHFPVQDFSYILYVFLVGVLLFTP